MFIRSERLFLRPAWPEDWAELHGAIDDAAVVRNLARSPWPYRADDARWFVSRAQDARHPDFLVTLPAADGARIIGCAGIAPGEHGAVELGYWIAREQWGRGYATEAANAVLSIARALGHDRIEASHFLDNPASGRVLRKLGFKPTGEHRPRHSEGRGTVVTSVVYETRLREADNGDGGGDGQEPMRHAA
ncbi:GNAT family acetyltransferase [Novosphingobium fuchskuhlense]|uniref:GNAT family acetyltransferase n=1 Tax=Novosphingobium fuchskuhlense TaxID=1117702 RepID=A0A124JW34_9SPHN|nr:GNAT family N-acetyltransferase [Novosphingobium fuchskuhlense]KUR72919.1 GNAT family acetyltransferase [Novosphingobium fuchskuhlense]